MKCDEVHVLFCFFSRFPYKLKRLFILQLRWVFYNNEVNLFHKIRSCFYFFVYILFSIFMLHF